MTKPPYSASPYQRHGFAPLPGEVEHRNAKTTYVIDHAGRVTEHISLVVKDARRREELILVHYLRNHGRCFAQAPFGVNIIGRDCPWDFDVKLSDGWRFFLEVTAIADGRQQFEMLKREEQLSAAKRQPKIRRRDLKKLAWMFPDPALDEVLASLSAQGIGQDGVIANPLFRDGTVLFFGRLEPPAEPLLDRIVEAILKKTAKKHGGKDRTVLLLDYQGLGDDAADINAVLDDIAETLDEAPFLEIWVYVGYSSDGDGNRAEFSLKPLKLPPAKWEALARFAEQRGIDQHGRVIW